MFFFTLITTWAALWIVFWQLFKHYKIPQPLGAGWLASMMVLAPISFAYIHFNPDLAELKKRATMAEQQYFLLSNGSLDHDRICQQANIALKNYKQLGDQHKTELFAYIVMSDKCL